MPITPFIGISGSLDTLLITLPFVALFVWIVNSHQMKNPLSPKAVAALVGGFILALCLLLHLLR